ncbi:MAG: hypothetical protein ACK502_06235 [Alphaproteobacteria bacterium]
MEKTININGTKIDRIILRSEGVDTGSTTSSITIHPKPDVDQLELTVGMTSMLKIAGFTGRLTLPLSPEKRRHDLPVYHHADGAVTIRQIPQHRTNQILANILAGLYSAKLLSQAEEYAAEQQANLALQSSEFATRMAKNLGGRIQSITIQTPRNPGESDRSNIIVRFKPFASDTDDYQTAFQNMHAARNTIMPEGNKKFYILRTSPDREEPTFTIVGIPTDQVDEAAKKLVKSLLAATLLTQPDSTEIYKYLGLTPSRRPPSSGEAGQSRPR